MKQISICDVTLWGIARSQPYDLSSESLCEIADAIDDLQVDEILIPDRLLVESEMAAELCSAITSAQIIIAVTDSDAILERITNTRLTDYAIRLMNEDERLTESELKSITTSGCRRIEFEADTHRAYSAELLHIYEERGVRRLVLADHSARLLPIQVNPFLQSITKWKPDAIQFACRFRHDMGVSVANSLAAIECGITHLDCSILGVGPFAGYTPLEELATTLRIHSKQYGGDTRIATEKLIEVNELIARLLNLPICPNKPISGENIFATEAGIHQDGLLKNPDTYLPYRPELVGASGIQLVIGRHSGKRAVAHRLEELGHAPNDAQVVEVLKLIKTLPKGEKVTDEKLSVLFSRTS